MSPNNRPTFKDLYDVVNERFDKLEVILNGHNQRIAALERFKEKALLLWAVVVALATIGYDYLKAKVFHK